MTSSLATLHLVDSIEYAENNCFQHQLGKAMRAAGARTIPLSSLMMSTGGHNPVVCCLKQRTLHAHLDALVPIIKKAPVVIYDQDPWEAFRDGSPYKGVYERACQRLNVKAIAVTTQSWANFMLSRGLPAFFVNMWVLPEYCWEGNPYGYRAVRRGFFGSLHPYRKQLFDELSQLNCPIEVRTQSLEYRQYLGALSGIRVFVHREDAPVIVDGKEMNLRDGLWIKDIEAASQGCFSVRNVGEGSESYFGSLPIRDGKTVLRLFERASDVPDIIHEIDQMDPRICQSLLDSTVDAIRKANKWQDTARLLVTLATKGNVP